MKGTWDADRDPLTALRSGDQGPFENFVRTEIGTFLGFFQRLGADRAEAEDLAQEVFLKLYRSAASYDPQSRFSSFALRVARNAWIDRRRRRAVRPQASSLDETTDDERPRGADVSNNDLPVHQSVEIAEDKQRLAAAIRTLPRMHAAVFELAVIQGLPYGEIAETLGIPVGTVKSRVFNALRKLRESLGEGGAA